MALVDHRRDRAPHVAKLDVAPEKGDYRRMTDLAL
jgi:hypothetical protein